MGDVVVMPSWSWWLALWDSPWTSVVFLLLILLGFAYGMFWLSNEWRSANHGDDGVVGGGERFLRHSDLHLTVGGRWLYALMVLGFLWAGLQVVHDVQSQRTGVVAQRERDVVERFPVLGSDAVRGDSPVHDIALLSLGSTARDDRSLYDGVFGGGFTVDDNGRVQRCRWEVHQNTEPHRHTVSVVCS